MTLLLQRTSCCHPTHRQWPSTNISHMPYALPLQVVHGLAPLGTIFPPKERSVAWRWHTTHTLCFTIVEKWSHPLITAIALANCCSTQALQQACTVTFDTSLNKNWPNYLCTFKDRYLEMRFLHTYMAFFVWKVFCSSSTIMKPESETNLITYHHNALTPHKTRDRKPNGNSIDI